MLLCLAFVILVSAVSLLPGVPRHAFAIKHAFTLTHMQALIQLPFSALVSSHRLAVCTCFNIDSDRQLHCDGAQAEHRAVPAAAALCFEKLPWINTALVELDVLLNCDPSFYAAYCRLSLAGRFSSMSGVMATLSHGEHMYNRCYRSFAADDVQHA
jgi:hypothetical protein